MVLAKSKRWHHQTGQLTNPFKRVQVLGPSPLTSSGWVAKDKQNRSQHLRTVVTPSKTLEAVLELQEVDLKDKGIKHRLVGKQPIDPHPLKDAMSRHFDAKGAAGQPALRVLRAGGETTDPTSDPILDAGVPTPLNSLSVWQFEEDVNDLGEAIDQPMEPVEEGDHERETEGVELEVSGPLRDYLQELEWDFSGGGLEFMEEEEEVDETEPESEGDESGWRAWECLGELAMVCCGDCGLLQPRHPHQVPTENPRDLRGCGVVVSSMQAAVEGTLDLVEATQISCGFCGGNLEYVDDYREKRTGGIWKGTSCSWDQAEEWHAMEVRSHAHEEIVE